MEAVPPLTEPLPPRLFLYDGVCGLCDRTVQFLLARDPAGALRFAPLQGPTAAALATRHPEITGNLDTVIYLEDGVAYVRSEAVLRACGHLPAPWRLLRALRWIPAVLRDVVYRLVARSRYRIWGRYDTCKLPSEDEAARFLP